ncbi:hypothetical protein FQR65_LT08085 [Abscondita terminalis]|nr:hypothetical protein FQR65_LT08085 [Abscondita terminalis]
MDTEENTSKSVTKKSRMRPTQSYYVPPAQRSVPKKNKSKDNSTKESKQTNTKTSSKKNDKFFDAFKIDEISNETTVLSESVYSSQILDSSSISVKIESECFECQPSEVLENQLPRAEDEKLEHDSHNLTESLTSTTCATLVNEILVVQNLENTLQPDCILISDSFIPENNLPHKNNDEHVHKHIDEDEAISVQYAVEEASSTENNLEMVKSDEPILCDETSNIVDDTSSPQTQSDEIVPDDSENRTNFSHLYISYDDEMKKKSADCDTDNEKEEMKRALENINRKRRPLIKNIHNEDTLWISKSNVQSQRTTNYSENEKNTASKDNARIVSQEDQNNLANWEDMFDENGELHSEYIGEIVKQIGCEVKVVKASHDYSAYQNTKYQDLEHVIELYDFPSNFKTQDIMQLYRGASQNPMYVKWCDDTHCLLVLSTPAQAQRALQIEHDIIKSRPLTAASSVAASTASSTDLRPAMKRPQTNMQTARRLINTHLGTKSTLSKEEVEQERQALRDAREQRRLERQSEKDAWEGRPRNTKS